MLEFTKKTEFTKTSFTIAGNILLAFRYIYGKSLRLVVEHDGTVGDATKKVNRVTNMPDDLFRMCCEAQEPLRED